MKYIELDGKTIQSDIKTIKAKLSEDSSILFIYSGEGTLYDYIRLLNDGGRGLNNDDLYNFKVCYERKKLSLTYTSSIQDGTTRRRQISSISSLINELDGASQCRIVVGSDNRADLAFVVQQLIFLQYPLTLVDILLKQEVRDANKIKRFMEKITRLHTACDDALKRLTEMRVQVSAEEDSEDSMKSRLGDIDSALESCTAIKKDLDKASEVELKLAVTASKKTGKSVIVNCFLGEEVAPTDAELATPNNCIYRRSPDGRYHLEMDDQDAVLDFDTREQIHDEIDKRFRHAQNDVENGFQLADMLISYCTEENNFSSYTIYDTAGPDAAGTNHRQAAERAIHECDVAIFAIDYSKYLTETEAEYLKEVRSIFEGQRKFHSLIFALNKIDVRYNDPKAVKSIISSVDFIRTRLANISSEYADCIIFPTCSLEYFSVLEAQAAEISELKDDVTDLKALRNRYRSVPALQWLYTHSENLEYYHGISIFSAEVFKKDSGMPALMSYVSYVATSKARDEIVNNVAFQIDGQNKKLRSVLKTIANLEELINLEEQQIQNINTILERYDFAIQVITQKEFTDDDMKGLSSPNYLYDEFHGDLNELRSSINDRIKTACRPPVISSIITEKVRILMWERLSECSGPMTQTQCENVLQSLCGGSDLTEFVRSAFQDRAEDLQKKYNEEFKKVREEIKSIGARRQDRLREESDNTRSLLAKQNVHLQLPEIPDFEFDVPFKPINLDKLSIPSFQIGSLDFNQVFKKEGGVLAAVKRFFSFGRSTKFERRVEEKEFNQIFDKSIRAEISDTVCTKHEIPSKAADLFEQAFIVQYADLQIKQFYDAFNLTMTTQREAVGQFKKAIDDREQYNADITLQMNRKKTIKDIHEATSELSEIWDAVIEEVQEVEQNGVD